MSTSTAGSSTPPPRVNKVFPSITLRQPGGYSAEILLYGGQVISWKNNHGHEMLFVSTKAVYKVPYPIRGGIPICFPKFFNDEGTGQHGFARRRNWRIHSISDDNASADFILTRKPFDYTNWPDGFQLLLRVILSPTGDLKMISRVKNLNTDGRSFTFPFSYQNYFYVSNIRNTMIEGLDGQDYLDYLQNNERSTQGAEPLTFESEVDRVYLDTPNYMISVTDIELNRTFTISKNGSLPEFVVWNPWDEKAKQMADLDDTEYLNMVCVEAAAVENEITLNPGEEWTAIQRLSFYEKPGDRINRGGQHSVILRQPGGYSAEVLFYGAQVVSWKNERGEELLYLSKKAKYKRHDQIRGGIPIYFPGFSDGARIEQHGFARIRFWSLDTSVDSAASTDKSSVDLILRPSDCDLRNWNHKFEFRLRVTLEHNGDLTMTSRIKNLNTNEEPFTFQFSYHNYFSVSDISEIRIEGLETMDYLDYMRNRERRSEGGEAFTFDSEVDRVYLDTPSMIAVMDHKRIRTYTIRKDASLPDIVVWNPWDKKAKKMVDLDNTECKQMVCVEAAAVETAITLNPGDEWTGTQRLSVEASSYSDALPQPGILL